MKIPNRPEKGDNGEKLKFLSGILSEHKQFLIAYTNYRAGCDRLCVLFVIMELLVLSLSLVVLTSLFEKFEEHEILFKGPAPRAQVIHYIKFIKYLYSFHRNRYRVNIHAHSISSPHSSGSTSGTYGSLQLPGTE